MPHGMPTNSRSARCASRARSVPRAHRHCAVQREVHALHRHSQTLHLLDDADHVVGPVLPRAQLCQLRRGPLGELVHVLRVHAKHTVARARRGDKAGHLHRDRHHKAEVVVRVLADQVHTAGGAVHGGVRGVAKLLSERLRYDGCFRESHKRMPPNSAIAAPA
jgi:hypothetical protein